MDHKRFILELWNDSKKEDHCPYISYDGQSCHCSNIPNKETAQMVCDHFSLQLWCLSKDHANCVFFVPPDLQLKNSVV